MFFGERSRGCSSNGRAPALHAGGTGIDTLLLHTSVFFCFFFRGDGALFIKGKYGFRRQGALAQW